MSQVKPNEPRETGREPFFDIVSLIILAGFTIFTLIAVAVLWPDYQRSKLAAQLGPYRAKKDRVSAIPYYETAIRKMPKNRTYYLELIEGYIQDGQPEKALETIERAKTSWEDFSSPNWQAMANYDLNPGEATGEVLVEAYKKSPKDPALTYYVAKYMADEGNHQDAGALLLRLATDPFWNEKADGLRRELVSKVFGDAS